MRVANRIVKLEERRQVGRDKDGQCRYCSGRGDLGRHVVLEQFEDGPQTVRPGHDATPTPCPRCGRDLNLYVLLRRVDMIAKRRAEGGWLSANRCALRDPTGT